MNVVVNLHLDISLLMNKNAHCASIQKNTDSDLDEMLVFIHIKTIYLAI